MSPSSYFGRSSPPGLVIQTSYGNPTEPPNSSRTVYIGGHHNLGDTSSPSTADKHILVALAALSIAALFVNVLLHAGAHAYLIPPWLRPFAAEEAYDTAGLAGPRPDADNNEDEFQSLPPASTLKRTGRRRWNAWTVCLSLVALAGLALSIVPLVLEGPRRRFAWGVLEVMAWCCATLMTALERPIRVHRILLLQYVLIILASAGMYAAHFLDSTLPHSTTPTIEPFRAARIALCVVAVGIIAGFMPIRDPSWSAVDIGGKKGQPPSYHLRSPEDDLTLIQFWTMSWVNPLASLCQRRELVVEDVWQLPLDYQHNRLYLAFRELRGRLIPRLLEANGLDLFIAASLSVVDKVAEVSNIRLTSRLYGALDKSHGGDVSEAVFWCAVMLCVDALRQVAKTTAGWYGRKAYERSRGETFIALFSKLLTRAVPGSDMTEKGPLGAEDEEEEDGSIPAMQRSKRGMFGRIWSRFRRNSNKSKNKKDKLATAPLLGKDKDTKTQQQGQPASNAKVVNLVRGDTYEISQRFWDFNKLIAQPIKVIFTMYYLIDIMGWPSVVGVGLMVLFMTINSFLVRQHVKLERQRTALSDKRAQAVAHFVEASRPLKLNGWTAAWADRIMRFRDLEMFKRLQISYITAGIGTVNVVGGASYPLASICLYTLVLGRGLPNEVIWPSLQLFSQLEASVKEAFDLISAYWRATIPVERVNKYMDEPDRDDDFAADPNARDINFVKASFSWPSTSKLVLEDITLSFPTGLTVVRGHVGAGKSSLLLAALNEMEMQQGPGSSLARPDEPVGYAQQLPWLQNRTIRENIVFHHQPFDAARYRQVLHACALTQDLATFADGDLTRLEEGGVGLSGGQKARVALARAIYSPCRILLLDDPLAALDHDTASTIVQRFLCGPLSKGRTIVMVTHRDDLVLRIADQVVDMTHGKAHVLTPDEVKTELEHPYHGDSSSSSHRHGDSASSDSDSEETDRVNHSDEQDAPVVKDQPEEAAETGGVSLSVYTKYMQAGGWHLWISLAVFYGLSRWCDVSRASLLEVSFLIFD